MDIHLTTLKNDPSEVIRDRREIARVIYGGLPTAFFSWVGWIFLLGAVRYIADETQGFAFEAIFFVGILLINMDR